MLHNQGFERELCERICHLLVTDPFEEKVDPMNGDGRYLITVVRLPLKYEVTFWKIAL